jgi:hypothetical protein
MPRWFDHPYPKVIKIFLLLFFKKEALSSPYGRSTGFNTEPFSDAAIASLISVRS